MSRLRRMAGPSAATLCMLLVLCGLGVWQLRRLEWKRGILAAIDRAEASPPIPLPAHPNQFQKIGVTGTWLPSRHVLYGADVRDTVRGPQMGGRLIEPLLRPGLPPLLIDRGWVPDQPDRPIPSPAGIVSVAGYIRVPDHSGPFTPKDDPATGRVFTLDPVAMGRVMGLGDVAPVTLVLLGEDTGAYPVPATTLPRPPNDHLSYAITWFGLAVVLLVMFLSWLRKALNTPES